MTRPNLRQVPPEKQAAPAEDEDGICDDETVRIPPGDYEAAVVKIESMRYHQQPKIHLRFRIITAGEAFGVELSCYCNRFPKYRRGMKYYQMWMRAAGRRPHRGEGLAREIFRNKVLLIRVRDVVRDAKQVKLAAHEKYSTIDTILGKVTG